MLSNQIYVLTHIKLTDLLDIILLTIIIYSFIRLIRDSKAYQMAIGLAIVGILFLITQLGQLGVTHWLIRNFINYLIIAIIVLFQGELRRFLTSLGSRSLRKSSTIKDFSEKLDDLFIAVEYLSKNKIGALIAIEKEISLKSYMQSGTKTDAVLSKELLVSLFFPHSPLHDGAVIMKDNKIGAAGCLLPLPASHKLGNEFQTRTRHLAAIGLSQETDAAVVVVSEETGSISLAVRGKLKKISDKDILKDRLYEHLR